MKLFFVAQWQKDKAKTWSGTTWHLREKLSEQFDIVDIEVKKPLALKLFKLLGINKSDSNTSLIKYSKKNLLKRIKHNAKSNPRVILQLVEFVDNSEDIKTFIYQDLSVSYVSYLLTHAPELFAYSGLAKVAPEIINKRHRSQDEYYKNCSGIFTMGKWLKKDLVERCNLPDSKVHHVGAGINLDKNLIDSTIEKAQNKILFIGRDFERKGGFLVYEAFKHLKSKEPDVELYVAGPSADPIDNPIDEYFFLGDCDSNKLTTYLNKCDIFCMPSYFEAYGLVFIEALSFGLPCIGRNAFEMPYFIEDGKTGLLIEEDNVEELANKISILLKEETIKQNVLAKIDWYIKEYSWDTVAKRIYSHIQ